MKYSTLKELRASLEADLSRLNDWNDTSALIAALRTESLRSERAVLTWLAKLTSVVLFRCDHCREYRAEEGSVNLGSGDVICAFCHDHGDYFTCWGCEEVTHDDESGGSYRGHLYCRECWGASYTHCPNCGDGIRQTDTFGDNNECESCYDAHGYDSEEGEVPGVFGYGTVVTNHLAGKRWLSAPNEPTDHAGNGKAKSPTLWLGFELEVISRDGRDGIETAAKAVNAELFGRGILKEDRSIDGPGFEVVSLPGTLRYHQTQWDSLFVALGKHCKGWRAPSCGMHVHMSRDALTPLQIARMLVFINGDAKTDNLPFIERVAGRGATEFCKIHKKKLSDAKPRRWHSEGGREGLGGYTNNPRLLREMVGSISRAVQDGQSDDRYQAVNLQPSDTIEIRIFQSNVAPLGFLKNLEFCAALAEFCAVASNTGLQAATFLTWLDGKRGVYPNLTRWAVRERMLTKIHTETTANAALALAA